MPGSRRSRSAASAAGSDRSTAVSSPPPRASSASACSRPSATSGRPGTPVTAEQLVGRRERRDARPADLEHPAVLARQPVAQPRRLPHRAARGDQRPGRRLVGRVEQRRPQPGPGRLQPADEVVGAAERVVAPRVDVHREHPGRLPGRGLRVGADHLGGEPVTVGAQHDRGLVVVPVDAERQRHRAVVRRGVPLAEAELGRLPEVEGAGDVEVHRGHRASVAAGTDSPAARRGPRCGAPGYGRREGVMR